MVQIGLRRSAISMRVAVGTFAMTLAEQATVLCCSEPTALTIRSRTRERRTNSSVAREFPAFKMTFHDDRPPEMHSMPPGGFRLAIINCWNPEAGFEVPERLAPLFQSSPLLQTRLRELENRAHGLVEL